MSVSPTVLKVRRGRAPNCSATGSVVGLAILSVVAASAVLNAFADRFARWTDTPPGPQPGNDPTPGSDPGPVPPNEDVPRLRRESFGGLVAWSSPPAVLYVDHAGADAALAAGARLVGGDPVPAEGTLSAPIEVHIAVTDRCPVACDGCYLDAGPDKPVHEPTHAALTDDLQRLADMGVLEIALGGGEALLRDDVIGLADTVRALGMVPNVTTSGFGLTEGRAAELAARVGQVNVSLDGLSETYAAVRGWDGTAVALRALSRLRDAGVRTGVNTVVTRRNLHHLDALADTLVAQGVSEWQWLRFKPAGRGAEVYSDLALTADEALSLWPRLLAIEARTGLEMRVDCAFVPFVVAHAPPLEAVERLALSGCPGGDSLWSRSADGRWAPCSFAHATSEAVASPQEGWQHDGTLAAWRARAVAPPEPCASCTYRSVCRGGCRIVAAHVTGDALAPDPACPRVLAWQAA